MPGTRPFSIQFFIIMQSSEKNGQNNRLAQKPLGFRPVMEILMPPLLMVLNLSDWRLRILNNWDAFFLQIGF